MTSGNPEPQVVWLFNNQIISDSNNAFPRGNTLYIRNAQVDLNGYFTCRAIGPEGEFSEDSTLITVKEIVPEPENKFRIEIILVQLQCLLVMPTHSAVIYSMS